MRALIYSLLYLLRIHNLFRFINRRKVTILMYHGFTDFNNDPLLLNHQGKHLNIKKFKKQMIYLNKKYNIISMTQLIELFSNGSKIPDYSAVITIDDGYKSNYKLAFPVINELKIPVIIFPLTSPVNDRKLLWIDRLEYALLRTQKKSINLKIGARNYKFDLGSRYNKMVNGRSIRILVKSIKQDELDKYLDQLIDELDVDLMKEEKIPNIYQILEWDEIIEMIESGLVTIGSHTHSHYNLKNCDVEIINNELLLSKKLIENKTKKECLYFSYPHGKKRSFSELTKELLKKTDYKCALTTEPGMNDGTSDIFKLKRYSVSNNDSFHGFVYLLCGAREKLSKLKNTFHFNS